MRCRVKQTKLCLWWCHSHTNVNNCHWLKSMILPVPLSCCQIHGTCFWDENGYVTSDNKSSLAGVTWKSLERKPGKNPCCLFGSLTRRWPWLKLRDLTIHFTQVSPCYDVTLPIGMPYMQRVLQYNIEKLLCKFISTSTDECRHCFVIRSDLYKKINYDSPMFSWIAKAPSADTFILTTSCSNYWGYIIIGLGT